MARNDIHAELLRQREQQLRRAASRDHGRQPPAQPRPHVPEAVVTIRLAAADDERELLLLAEHDNECVPTGPTLLAEVGGVAVAALSLASSSLVTDPSKRTGEAVELLQVRASQLSRHGFPGTRSKPRLGGRFSRALATRWIGAGVR